MELLIDGVEILHRIPALAAGYIHHMDKQTAPVNVPEEIMTQAGTLGGALDDAGDIRHDEGHALLDVNHAQVGEQGGEVVVGDFRPCVGGDGEQCGLAHVGEAYQTYVRQQLQFQNHIPLLTLQAGLGESGHLPGGGGVVGIAPAPTAAPGNDKVLAGGHIHDDLTGLGIPDNGAPGDVDDEIFAPFAGHFPTHAVDTGGCLILALIAEVQQSGQIVVDVEHHTAAMTAVAAVGAAGGNVFFPVEGHGAVAAPSADDRNANLIYKHSISLHVLGG